MSDSTARFITGMKLRELKKQREHLSAAYAALAANAAEAKSDAERIRILDDGLADLKFAGRPLHPDVTNLDLLTDESQAFSPELLQLWTRRLDQELARGRQRCEIVYIFGGLLEEWSRDSGDAVRAIRARVHQELLDAACSAPGDPPAEPFLAELLDPMREAFEDPPGDDEEPARTVHESELELSLPGLASNPYHTARLRREAQRFAASVTLRKDLADALSILLVDRVHWRWPQAMDTRVLWTRNKWRLYLDEDLPTVCLLNAIGRGWVDAASDLLMDPQLHFIARAARRNRLTELNAPDVILANEDRMLGNAAKAFEVYHTERDPWRPERRFTTQSTDWIAPGSVLAERADKQRSLRSIRALGGEYDGESGNIGVVALVNAEVQSTRAAYPDKPVYVLKADLRNFYSTIPHETLRALLRKLIVPPRWQAFYERFLTPTLKGPDGREREMRRGVPNAHLFSSMLAELLMRCLDQHLYRTASVRVIRLVDDIALLACDAQEAAKAWRAIEAFCKACGLELNTEKSGGVCIGPGALPADLPQAAPRWGLLSLGPDGNWTVHDGALAAHLQQARDEVNASPSILRKVQAYNANARYLVNNVALGLELGEAHRRDIKQALRRYHTQFFDERTGIVDGLGSLIRQRFFGGAADVKVPEAWMYWPVTAGGLGLTNPLLTEGQYAIAYQKRERPTVPKKLTQDWDTRTNDWSDYYQGMLSTFEPLAPKDTPVMKTLMSDFIARGAEITGGKQDSLSPYWQWVLYTYGPQIIEEFGTFRFLITELVPLQLIADQHMDGAAMNDGESDDDD